MSSSEGGREIQLAKERLASAKARVESASKGFVAAKETKKQIAKATKKMMETANRGVKTAQLELLSSQSEVKKAKESLEAVEKRREVVNVDSDSDDDTKEGNSKKKIKVSSGEEASNYEDTTDDEENNNSQIVVMGCGSTEVNGTYEEDEVLKRIVNCPSGCCDNNPVFVKDGCIFQGKQGNFMISKSHWGIWQIIFRPDSSANISPKGLYRTTIPQITKKRGEGGYSLPPTNGWIAVDKGLQFGGQDPPPTIEIQL